MSEDDQVTRSLRIWAHTPYEEWRSAVMASLRLRFPDIELLRMDELSRIVASAIDAAWAERDENNARSAAIKAMR